MKLLVFAIWSTMGDLISFNRYQNDLNSYLQSRLYSKGQEFEKLENKSLLMIKGVGDDVGDARTFQKLLLIFLSFFLSGVKN